MIKPLTLLSAVVLASAANQTNVSVVEGGVGDQLYRVFTKYYAQPITQAEATQAGWKQISDGLISGMGYAYTQGGVLSKKKPSYLYFTEAGQLAGVGTDVYGSVKAPLLQAGYFEDRGKGRYHIAVTFRDAAAISSPSKSTMPLGDRLIVNAAGIAESLPMSEKEAISQMWHRGSCFDGMGWHYFKDIKTTTSDLSWVAANLLPVVVMYHEGAINAVFFATTDVQQSVFPWPSTNEWEPIPLPNNLMCGNTCDSDCTFSDTKIWSTMHWYFNDYKAIKCASSTVSCKISGLICCEK